MADSSPIPGKQDPDRIDFLEVYVCLAGMDPDDHLCVVLPGKLAIGTVSDVLAHTFPAGEDEQRSVSALFDTRANPDLPEIYAVLLDAFNQCRKGRCTMLFSGVDGLDLDVECLVSHQLEFGTGDEADLAVETPDWASFGTEWNQTTRPGGNEIVSAGGGPSQYPRLEIHIDQQYRAIDHAMQTGSWRSKEELLEWLQTLTVVYFLDKHGAAIPESPPGNPAAVLKPVTDALQSQGLIAISRDAQTFSITAKGRGFISHLLIETESYIDLYDHFKDTCFIRNDDVLDGGALDRVTEESNSIEFDTGVGVDLRVQVFETEGLDPVRTVFLLRLYDGTLDEFISTWQGLIHEESFFDCILEPVLNRSEVDEAFIAQVVESGYAYLEEREERARELKSQQEIIGRVWA